MVGTFFKLGENLQLKLGQGHGHGKVKVKLQGKKTYLRCWEHNSDRFQDIIQPLSQKFISNIA